MDKDAVAMRWLIIIAFYVFLNTSWAWVSAWAQGGTAPGSQGPSSTPVSGGVRALWIVAAYAVSLLLFAIELVLPSGGILAIGSAVAAVVGIVLMFQVSTMMGLVGLTVTIVALPFLFAYALKLLPDTPIFRWMTLGVADTKSDGSKRSAEGTESEEENLVGLQGVAQTDLYPSGTVEINGKRYDAVSIVGQLDKGAVVQVVGKDAFGLKIRRVDETDEAC